MNLYHNSNSVPRFGALLYAVGLSVGAVAVAIGGYLVGTRDDYHAAMSYGVLLAFSIPFIAIAGLLGVFTYRWYLAMRGAWRGRAFYVLQMLVAIVVGIAGSFVLAWVAK